MSEELRPSVEAAWKALWKSKGAYDLPATLKSRRRVGLIWFRPIGDIALPDTGPVVILNREPWGMVTVNLKNGALSHFHSIHPVSFEYNAETDEVQAQVKFSELKYAGDYEVQRGHATASALKLASKQLRPDNALAATAADPSDNLSLAKSYQDKLATQGGNGPVMLDQYYRHNDSYAQAFTNSKFKTKWATYPTNGKVTQDFANQTATAASPGNTGTVSVNGQPDSTGASDYNIHAFSMQLMLVATCNTQGNTDAATAASKFHDATDGPSKSAQTVDNVMTMVAKSPPVTATAMLQMAAPVEPAWKARVRDEVAPHLEEIEREEDDVRRGLLLRETTERPIHAAFGAYFPSQILTLTGKIVDSTPNGSPGVEFRQISGNFHDVPVQLGAFPGKLHGELVEAMGRAGFLKSILGKRVNAAVAASPLLGHINRLMTLAMHATLGPVE
jgi:hypothetical protein